MTPAARRMDFRPPRRWHPSPGQLNDNSIESNRLQR